MRKWVLGFLILMFAHQAFAEGISLDMQAIKVADALRVVAKFLNQSVVISPEVKGELSLNLDNEDPEVVLNAIINSRGLAKWYQGDILYISTQAELIKRTQEKMKWQQVWSEAVTLSNHIWQIRYANAGEVIKLIKGSKSSLLSKRGMISADERTNLVYIQDTPQVIAKVDQLIRRIDVPIQQIAIEARLASVDDNFVKELGVAFDSVTPSAVSGRLPGYSLMVARLADGSQLDVKLLALERAGHAELISRPRLFTANQQAASIEAGEEVPYQEVSESGGTAVAFKKAVLGLKVTPQVLPGNKVLLKLQINEDRPSSKVVLGMPTISTRQIVTNVMARNKQTIVLGGIYETNLEKNQQGVPFISHLPLIGWFFRYETEHQAKRELLIFVTPTIIK